LKINRRRALNAEEKEMRKKAKAMLDEQAINRVARGGLSPEKKVLILKEMQRIAELRAEYHADSIGRYYEFLAERISAIAWEIRYSIDHKTDQLV
jgi:predicted DNA-binding helix-hairpin-helix protein